MGAAFVSHDVQAEDQDMQVQIDQGQMNAIMNRVFDLIMPDYKKIYKQHYDEIEWLERHYVVDVQCGEAIISIIAQEFEMVLADKMDEIIEIMFKEMHLPVVPSEEEKAAFKNIMVQILPMSVTQSLRKSAELKSSVYQEIIAERK